MKPMYNDPRVLLTDLILWINAIRDWIPDFEQRMINRERRFRLRHTNGKITDERLAIELEAIEQRRAAKASK